MVTAELQIDSITAPFSLLAEHPKLVRARDDLLAGARSFQVGNYMIVYVIEGEDVQFLRILHGRRNIAVLFGRYCLCTEV